MQGVNNPLFDPRIPNLIVAVGRYRSTNAVALFGSDNDWRVVVSGDEPVIFMANVDAPMIESPPVQPGTIERLASGHGVLADLFPAGARVA